MSSRIDRARWSLVAAIGASAILMSCEDSGVTAPSDSVLIVTANPGTVNIDPQSNETEASTRIRVELYDAAGLPLSGVPVSIATGGGTLASGGQSRNTNAVGVVEDTLTLKIADPDEVEVTARSSSVSATATVNKTVGEVNKLPRALITTSPKDVQVSGKPVIFDGTGSVDEDEDALTMFRWTIVSDKPDTGQLPTRVIEGPTVSALTETFVNLQSLAITLEISDDPEAPIDFARGLPVSYSPNSAAIAYRIACGQPPIAAIAGQSTGITAPTGAGTSVLVLLDGTLSSDADGIVDRFTWTCGNGSIPTDGASGGKPFSRAVCSYAAQQLEPKSYTATLIVTDNGNGTQDPRTGTFFCAQQSREATVVVTITPP